MSILSLGFTGTRLGMSDLQKQIVFKILQQHEGIFHHGDCIGADAEMHQIAKTLGWTVHVHPPINGKYRAFCLGDSSSPPKPYYERNKDIVNSCEYLLACPKDKQETGGTWWTINYAKARNAKFTIILPNGQMGHSVLEVGKEKIRG